jgi:predicted small metal-binding protein
MKQFACGDVVPGCDVHWAYESDDELMRDVAEHAAEAHGIPEVTPDLVARVRSRILFVD